jgi:hypothetical protein
LWALSMAGFKEVSMENFVPVFRSCEWKIAQTMSRFVLTWTSVRYFQRTEYILHVTIIHKHAILEYDGLDSTDNFPEIITEHFFVISPDLQHDHNFTKCAQQQIKQYLDSISYELKIIWLYFILFNTVVVFWVIMYTNAMFWRQILNNRFHLCTLPVSTMLMGRKCF